MATGQQIQTSVRNMHHEREFQLRDPASHDWQCQLLEGPLHDEHSVTYGINERSNLMTYCIFMWQSSTVFLKT